jgi:hypothetical protein
MTDPFATGDNVTTATNQRRTRALIRSARGDPSPIDRGLRLRIRSWKSVAGGAVDGLAKQVGVSVVTRVLLDHVQVDRADIAGAVRVVAAAHATATRSFTA